MLFETHEKKKTWEEIWNEIKSRNFYIFKHEVSALQFLSKVIFSLFPCFEFGKTFFFFLIEFDKSFDLIFLHPKTILPSYS